MFDSTLLNRFGLLALRRKSVQISPVLVVLFAAITGFSTSRAAAQVVETPEFVLDSGSVTAGGFEDSDGILWFATANGALRYDYRNAKYFNTKGSAFISRVGTIAEDQQGRIWFGRSAGGVVAYDKSDNSFVTYQHDPADPYSLSSNTMNWVPRLIATRTDGSVWVGTNNGLNVMKGAGDGFSHYFHDPSDPHSLAGNDIWGLHIDEKDRIWVATRSGLSRLDPGKDSFVNYTHDPVDPASLPSDQVNSVAEGRHGEIWLGTEKGLSRLDVSSGEFKNYRHDPDDPSGISRDHVLTVTVDSQGRLWLGRLFSVAAGVEMFDPATEKFHVILRNPNATSPDTTEMILSVFETGDGTIWLPYNTGPIYRIFPDRSIWTARFENEGLPEKHLEPVLAVSEDSSGGVWVGGVGGLKRYNKETKSYSRWQPVSDLSENPSHTLALNEVNTILQAADERLWIGEVDSSFLLVDVPSRTVLRRLKSPQSAFGTWGGVYDPSNPEVIWFGSQTSGLGRVDTANGDYQFFNSSSNMEAGITAAFVSRVAVSQGGTFWLSTWGQGLLKFDGEKVIASYLHDPDDPTSIGSSNVSEVELGPQGQLWVATIEGGLNVFDESTGTFERMGRKTGLTTNTIFAIETDEKGFLWLVTNAGVFQFDPSSRRVVATYGRKDALPSDVFLSWPGGTFMTSSQDLMLGTLSGMGVISIPLLTDEGALPRVIFTSLTQSGVDMPLQTAVERTKEVEIHWPITDFEFEASVIGRAGHANREIRYKLENFARDWFVADSASLGRYSRVPGGQYTLIVQGRVGDGPWGESTSLVVTVHPPFWQEIWFQAAVILVLLGSLIGFMMWRLSIAKRFVLAAEALRDSEERLRLLTDSVPLLIAYVDANRRYQFNNKVYEDWFGDAQGEFKGQHVKAVIGDVAYGVIEKHLERALKGETVVYETTVPFKDGGTRDVHSTYVPDFTKDGSVMGLYVLVEDVTDAKVAEERLRQAQKMEAVGQLTGGIAHDFNNLLAIVLGLAEEMQSQGAFNKDLLLDIIRTSDRGAELTHRLLAFSRQQSLTTQPIDLSVLVEGMSDLLTRSLGETILLKFPEPSNLWSAAADPSRVEDALLNLAINARHAMPDGGTLTIECYNTSLDEGYVAKNPEAAKGDFVVLAVSDSGTGMTKEVQERAFEPFYTTKEVGQGSGLGLSMIYGFAKQSGGHVSIYSELGQGTTIKLYLPRDHSLAVKPIKENVVETPLGSNEPVLLIEDDPMVRELTNRMLGRLGYQVTSVDGTVAAREALGSGKQFDLLLSDVVLPGGMSGPEFAAEAKARFPNLKIIFMSGYSAEAAKDSGFLGAGDVLLTKPFKRHQIAVALQKAITCAK
ncbi:two-component regulator propeller domain-containing protein [Parasedimentitalea maritima]|uniref:histidine kinase n=1 Tax=Parasedimentitalea maritima TaxID=2578117 RepID=A0A6A4R969_9RHOB|nr:two-component regulator propeller domain-containing protein [Zongyanglinia marina]KAE9624756.1 response regulator [Zongyanglinia marina]